MRWFVIPLVLLVGCSSASKVSGPHAVAGPADAVSNLNHPVSTSSATAQRAFNDGLSQVFAFNHDEAVRCFKKALEADPNLAMAQWGIALAVGPNYNVDVDAAREKIGYEAIHKAMEMSAGASEVEKDYIAAMARRFSNAEKPDFKQLAKEYADAMRDLSAKYPDDLDAATLCADAMMNLRPWKLWTADYKPAEGTETIVATLESVLKRDPDHVGANHLYIHAVEASAHPERALDAAGRLPTLAPSCGHLVHMPSHVYSRVGDAEAAVSSNEAAVAADREYFASNADMSHGLYNMMYYSHNMHFLAYAEEQQGNYSAAMKWANQLTEHVKPHVAMMPPLEAFMTVPNAVQVRCARWDDVLKSPMPDSSMPITTALWHFSRGMAFAAKGDLASAKNERDAVDAFKVRIPADAPFAMLNKAHPILDIATHTLDAKMASSQKNWSEAADHLKRAIELQHGLNYIEPPDWLQCPRESLGAVMLRSGDAAGAEKVFREDLDKNPRGARSLFGLWKSLEAQNKPYEADIIRRQFEAGWKTADVQLKPEDL